MADHVPEGREADAELMRRARASLKEILGDRPFVLLIENDDNGVAGVDSISVKVSEAVHESFFRRVIRLRDEMR